MGRARALDADAIDLDAYAAEMTRGRRARGDASASARPRVRVFRWRAEPKVLLLAFADATTQRRALGRVSMYVEDPDARGRVAASLPSGARGGVANYSGHNARCREVAAFGNAAAAHASGVWEEEREVIDALVGCGVMRRERDGTVRAREGEDWEGRRAAGGGGAGVAETCVIAVCASEDAREVRDALLHEAMHGLWYAREDHARWCYEFYRGDALSDAERATWVEFLRELRYDVSCEEVVVNEFQAYMATERVLFGADAVSSAKSGKRSSSRAVEALTEMQKKFAAAARDVVYDPPRCGNLRVVWETS